jgi:uncharacterized protein (TIRG00374 family)
MLRLAQAGLAIVLVAAVIVSSHPENLWRVLQSVDPGLCVAALALNAPLLVLTPVRASLVLRRIGYRVRRDVLVPSTIVGFVAGGLTPAASGELLRAQALRSGADVPLQPGITAIIYERVLSLYLLLVSTGLVLALTVLAGPWVMVAATAAAVLVVMPWMAMALAGGLLPPEDRIQSEGRWGSLGRRLLSTASQLRGLLADLPLLAGFAAVTLAMFGLIAVQYWFLARAAGTSVSVADAWLVFGVSTFAGVVALIPLGLGALDASLAAALARLGTTIEQGGVVALLVRAVVTLPLVLAALACYLYLQRASSRRPQAPSPGQAIKDHAVD